MTINTVQSIRPLMSPRFCEEKCGNFRSGSLSWPSSRSLVCWQAGCCWVCRHLTQMEGVLPRWCSHGSWQEALAISHFKCLFDWQFGCMPPSGEWINFLKRCLRICGQIMRPACPICLLPSVVWSLLGPDVTQT